MQRFSVFFVSVCITATIGETGIQHQYRHHRHRHAVTPHNASVENKTAGDDNIMTEVRALQHKLKAKLEVNSTSSGVGEIKVNGPLPFDFSKSFSTGVSLAEGVPASSVKLVKTREDPTQPGAIVLSFEASKDTVAKVQKDVADPESKLSNGALHSFFVSSGELAATPVQVSSQGSVPAPGLVSGSIDYDTEMPFGELEPFGREDTAQELTEQSVKESDGMVDQLERAEVSEEKRAVFRALTRLRGEAITSFDGIARSQTGNIDQYSKTNKWRQTHPLHHLANEEADVSKWAFPDAADF
uniref:Uncharacterized protein n=1 Tax=Noctiluca scintillans TaxID=2966 RepID=A0A7S0ZXZ0_NOCSC|mmetsp:Transcript_23757/g.62478  ORF Transcript_23757/g.62478 Transcript_23757/m.62478 type:complete len:299 (+) Transcript_23757:51-947(+)